MRERESARGGEGTGGGAGASAGVRAGDCHGIARQWIMPRGPIYDPDEDADILATLAPTSVRMAALADRTGRTPAALRKRYERLRSQAAARATDEAETNEAAA